MGVARTDPSAVHDLTRTIERQREVVLAMEGELKKYRAMRGQLQDVQNALVMGRVNDARVVLSDLLMHWPT